MKMFYEKDADANLIKNKKVAIFGYGSQGHAHALNLKDSGVKNVVVALRDGSSSIKKAESEGLKVMSLSDAAAWADVVMVLTPDELQASIYKNHIEPISSLSNVSSALTSNNLPVSGLYCNAQANPVSPVYLDFNTLTLVVLASLGSVAC